MEKKEHSKVKSGYPITGIAGKKDFMSIYVYKKHMSNEVGFIRKALSILEKIVNKNKSVDMLFQ